MVDRVQPERNWFGRVLGRHDRFSHNGQRGELAKPLCFPAQRGSTSREPDQS